MANFPYSCVRNSLGALNVLYMIIGLVILGVAGYARGVAKFTSLAALGALVAVGVILLLIAIIGFVAAIKHHQILLFMYMIFMSLLFIIDFAISIAALALNQQQQKDLLSKAYDGLTPEDKTALHNRLKCCGFNNSTNIDCPSSCDNSCKTCYNVVKEPIALALKAGGGVGLFFSFTFFLAIYFARQFRNLKDPRSSDSFL
ncbi:Tetraspanin-31 [Trichoplax sp. H2]|uniref:Tetraspanin n=1 Tax=Trichoplax adhaerens TaxID=10228 RepID=B3RQ35_TRIAD|nr:expressed hypothetical protein [Trichoplax adhaerens]EDV27750.1 expressed hypothetical protein [Trichoplax adhaerens]RDD40772.1 Tetraspanin-31 [Trichoplax sp. H2]|eukprot:XP_002109584.1 expressed hypothetical protein [Trichoplax adhaerens]